MTILIPIIALLAIGVICALLLTFASVSFAVKEDEKAHAIRECLPGANCGACGYSGCDSYAKALSQGQTKKTNLCIPGGDGVAKDISHIMGLEAENVVELVAYVACNNSAVQEGKKYEYDGPRTCKAVHMNYAGDNMCAYACLGYGDCLKVCPRNAISMNEKGIAYINPTKCIGCGLCAKECPNGLIHIFRDTVRIVVACNNHDKGAVVRKFCKNGCIACGKCEKTCPHDAIKVVNNLAVIDYDKCTGCGACKEVCPVKCIHEDNFTCGAHFE